MKSSTEAYKLIHHGSIALAEVESNGIRIDVPYLESTIKETEKRIEKLIQEMKKDEVYDTWKKTFREKTNLGSREQLGKIIFGKMGLRSKGTTATGRYKVDESALESIAIPFVKKFILVEKLKKTKTTYLEGILKETVNGYLHPFFDLHTTESQRSSSRHPNFQNLPIRDPELGKLVRRAFIPRKGNRIVENDFSAHEFRMAACFWKDQKMIAYVKEGRDIHRDVATLLFCCKPEQVNKETRYLAKNGFVFPVLYGSFYAQCAKNIWGELEGKTIDGKPAKEWLKSKGIHELGACDYKIPPRPNTFEAHVKMVEGKFCKKFSTWAKNKEEFYDRYKREGGFFQPTGFWISGIYSKNAVMNFPIQGGAFHCLMFCLIRLLREIRKRGWKAKVIGQIHDSIIGDVPEGEIQGYLRVLKRIVTVDLPRAWKWLTVPLGIEAELTPIDGNWHEKRAWIEDGKIWRAN